MMTHAELVERAAKWLKGTRGCRLVSTRQLAIAAEQPDCIGWMMEGWSVVIECKVSRADFRRDMEKPHRLHMSLGMGNERFYLTPGGLLEASMVPLPWGLIECWQGRIVARKSAVFVASKNIHEELKHVLACAVRGPESGLPPTPLAAGCLADCGL